MAKRKKQGKRPDLKSTYRIAVTVTTTTKGGIAPASEKEMASAVKNALTRDRLYHELYQGMTVTNLEVGPADVAADAGEE